MCDVVKSLRPQSSYTCHMCDVVKSLGFLLMLLVRSHVDARPDVMDLPVTQAPNVTVSP